MKPKMNTVKLLISEKMDSDDLKVVIVENVSMLYISGQCVFLHGAEIDIPVSADIDEVDIEPFSEPHNTVQISIK